MRLVTVTPNPSIDRLYELDRLVRGEVNRPTTETLVAGGKGLNVARAATALGAEARAVGLLAGHAGRWLADALAAEGIVGRWTWTAGETRSCFAIHDAQDGTLTELNEHGPTVDPTTWAELVTALSTELVQGGVGLVTISGSLPPGAPIDGSRELVSVAASLGVPVALDGGGEPVRLAATARPWLVKLNEAEAAATLGKPAGPPGPSGEAAVVEMARELGTWTGGAVIVTRGRAGAIALDPDGTVLRVAPPHVEGRYPVGSGDAFLAGVAVATLDGRGFVDALRLGAAAAIANAKVRGAARFEPAEVARVEPGVRVETFAG